MKYLVLFFALIVAGCFAVDVSEQTMQIEFTDWMSTYGKSYGHDEFQARWQTWKKNYLFIQAFNAQNHSFTVGMNQFGDLTGEEFNAIYKGLTKVVPNGDNVVVNEPVDPSIPASVDWRKDGLVTPVKNQGQCGSCWAFSTTGSTEGQHAKETKHLVGLSEQQLVDCSSSYGNQGCNGGLMTDAFRYIIANHGIDTEASYPYTARDGTCHFNKATIGATLVSYHNVPRGSEAALTSDCANNGPISVAIDAGLPSFQFYKSGVYYEPSCSSTRLDHGVLVVGYGALSGKDYYIVKNSWGASWGMAGYILMSRNRGNNCGIATMASWPTAPK